MDSKLFSRNQPGGMFSVTDRQFYPSGSIFWVHSVTGSDAAGFGYNPDTPVATLDYAVGLCTASKGDTIMVMPGHAEALTTATSLTMDVIGVRVIGLGNGRLKPQFSITTATTATWNVTAANCSIQNVDIISNFLNVASSMTVGASADGLTLQNVNFFDTSIVLGSLIGISIAAACNDVTIDGCKYYGIALTAPATNAILCAGAADRLTVTNSYFKGDFSSGIIVASAAKSLDVLFTNLLLVNMSETGKGILVEATTTGASDNVQAYLEDETGNEKAIAGAAMFMTDRVRQTNVVTASTYLCIDADS
jgi:hypothetical protein